MAETKDHVNQCCIVHGCAFKEEVTCPVWNGEVKQTDPCPTCYDEDVFPDEYFDHHRRQKNAEYHNKIARTPKKET